MTTLELLARTTSSEGHEPLARDVLSPPDLGVVDVVELGPLDSVAGGRAPLRAQRRRQQFVELTGRPRLQVDAVGYVTDRDLVDGQSRPESRPLLTGHATVQSAHAVAVARASHGEDRRAERVGRVVATISTECEQRLGLDAELAGVAREEALRDGRGEVVVTGGDGRVGREHETGPHRLLGLGEVQTLLRHDATDSFEHGEGAVPLVQVQDVRLDADRREGAHAAHTEHQLLGDARLDVAVVEARGDRLVDRRIRLDRGVEEVERAAPDDGSIDRDLDVAARQGHRDVHGAPVVVAHEFDRHLTRRRHVPGLVLASVAVEPLVRRAPVEQPDADERDAERARRLELLGRHRPESTGEDRQRVGEGELGREEGDDQVAVATVLDAKPRLGGLGAGRRVDLEVLDDGGGELAQRVIARQQLVHPRSPQTTQELVGPLECAGAGLGVEHGEQSTSLDLPRPAQIERHVE